MTVRDDAAALLKLPVAEYDSFDSERKVALQLELSAVAKPPGGADEALPPFVLATGAPETVDLDAGGVVPLLIGTVRTGLREWQVNPETNHHLLLRDAQSGAMRSAEPLFDARRGEVPARSAVGTPPTEFESKCVTTDVSRLDLRTRFSSILPGTYVATVVEHEFASNTVRFTAKSSTPRPATAPIAPQGYVQSALDPREDLADKVEVPPTAAKGAPLRIRLELRVAAESGGLATWQAQDGTPRWSWPCHLILLQLDKRPVVVPANGWVEPVGDRARPSRFNAVFVVDLRAAHSGLLEGDYLVYVDAGDRLLGSYPMRVD